jgi:uncharacterized damage-inducible protein DinB
MSHLLDAAFDHHAWATARMIEACSNLSEGDLAFEARGTRGSILSTLRHVVVGDSSDLYFLTNDATFAVEEEGISMRGLIDVAEMNRAGWRRFLERTVDPDEVVLEVDPDDGFERAAPIGFRLAAALQHGNDHRSQLCTALTLVGSPPPAIDVMAFGVATGRVTEVMPSA